MNVKLITVAAITGIAGVYTYKHYFAPKHRKHKHKKSLTTSNLVQDKREKHIVPLDPPPLHDKLPGFLKKKITKSKHSGSQLKSTNEIMKDHHHHHHHHHHKPHLLFP